MDSLDRLKKEVEVRFQRKPVSPADFNALSLAILRDTGENLSHSTLKRLWNYVEYNHRPTLTVRSILARYAGYADWQDFLESDSPTDVSGFIRKDILKAEDLAVGTEIEISWNPGRKCRLLYNGNRSFTVLESILSKLKEGDTFTAVLMTKGEPFYCLDLQRDGKKLGGYVAGKVRGLNDVRILRR